MEFRWVDIYPSFTTMRKPGKVLHIVPALFGSCGVMGGAERYAFELARHMAEAVPTRLVTFGETASHQKIGRLDVRVISDAWKVRGQHNNPVSLRLISEIVGQAKVVHCHQQHVMASSLAATVCRLTGRKVFVSDLGGGGWDVSAYVSTDRWYRGHLHISEYSRRVAGHDGWNRAHVIWGGVDTAKFSPASEPPVNPRNTVLYVGRLLPHKGINYLIEALPPGLSLRLIGRPYDENYVEELRRLAEGKAVIFDTASDDDALIAAYREALCVVLPSVYRDLYGSETRVPELLGQTLLEGMSCGIPAICTDVASMPEIVVNAVTGFIVPPNDPNALGEKLAWLRDHPEEANAMGAAGRRRVEEKFTWPQVVDRCLQAYGI
jgi:glycosyltransferase involved in cell wall biosynthesis